MKLYSITAMTKGGCGFSDTLTGINMVNACIQLNTKMGQMGGLLFTRYDDDGSTIGYFIPKNEITEIKLTCNDEEDNDE